MGPFIARFVHFLLFYTLFVPSLARTIGGTPQQWIKPYKRAQLQNIVTWDNSSLLVHGQRIMFYSGEFHPFRLPVPSLWLDVFQKIRSMGYTGVSFYVDWALLEGKPGEFNARGVFAFEPFFEAAKQAGIYLLARPGPYINAEVSGGGFPGWLQRIKGHPRTADADYLAATDFYVQSIGQIIAKAQITNGGPVILVQPENEYSGAVPGQKFPDPKYFKYVEDQLRAAGIVVPFLSNDAGASGHNAPGQAAAVDIYGHDGYPLGFDCANPTVWPAGKLPTDWRSLHLQQSPNTPYSIPEFQGGSFDPWGGPGFEKCTTLVNHEFQRVFFKNDISFGVTIFNIYMTYGGTNWGNLGHADGYSSYDYGAVITEDRLVHREKYSEAKLEANFVVSSPSYLSAIPGLAKNNSEYVNSPDLTVTALQSNLTRYLVVRHTDYASTASTSYKLTVSGTSAGDIKIPLAGGSLTLNGRDSKIHVIDYMVGKINLLYSTAEILTWQKYRGKTILIVYGGPNEQHEMGVSLSAGSTLPTSILGAGVNAAVISGITILSWKTTIADRALKLGPLYIYFVDRNSAYQHWVLDVPQSTHTDSPYTLAKNTSVIVKGGYLMRTARIQGTTLALTGDLNATTPLRISGGAPRNMTQLTFNGQDLPFKQDSYGVVTATATYTKPIVKLPSLADLTWYYVDSLPEIQPDYSDALWSHADYPKTDNTYRNLTTPTSLYGSEYGYHSGTLVFRGHFYANGNESTLYLHTQGGSAFGMSAWLNSTYLGSFVGYDAATDGSKTFRIPKLSVNRPYAITVVIDNMGLNENWVVGADDVKRPRGILDYRLSGHRKSDVSWKLTGNFGGENYPDKARGPLNEGGMFAERQGFHLPAPPVDGWVQVKGGPMQGIGSAGIGWFSTKFELNMPRGYDIPLAIVISNVTSSDPGSNGTPLDTPPIVSTSAISSASFTGTTVSISPTVSSTFSVGSSLSTPTTLSIPTIVSTSTTLVPSTTLSTSTLPPPIVSLSAPTSLVSLDVPAPIVSLTWSTSSSSTIPLPLVSLTSTTPQENGPVPWDSPLATQFGNSNPRPAPKPSSLSPYSPSASTPSPSPSPSISPSPLSWTSTSTLIPIASPEVPWPSVSRSDQRTSHPTIPPLIPTTTIIPLANEPISSVSIPVSTSISTVPFPVSSPISSIPAPVSTSTALPKQYTPRPTIPISIQPTRSDQRPPRTTSTSRFRPLPALSLGSYTFPTIPTALPTLFGGLRGTRTSSSSIYWPTNSISPYPPLYAPPVQEDPSLLVQENPTQLLQDIEPQQNRLLENNLLSPQTPLSTFSIDTPEEAISPEDPSTPAYRIQIFVNGWQFGKYVSNIGPQTKFPVPEGIWNYQGTNWVSVSFWALGRDGARVEEIKLVAGPAILTGYGEVGVVESPKWTVRKGAY